VLSDIPDIEGGFSKCTSHSTSELELTLQDHV
jgi:hypothetical protein